MRRFASCTLAVLIALGSTSLQIVADETHPAFSVLEQHCFKCHGSKKRSGKFDARTLDALLVGGKRGPAVAPGDSAGSRLLQLVQPGAKPHMPPGKKQLSAEEIDTLSAFIEGLPAQTPASTTHSQSIVESDSDKPPTSWLPPPTADPTTVVDLLVQSKYAERRVTPNAVASDSVFVRRVYLDLVGRIPSLDELNRFLQSTNSSKRSDLIDKLVASDEFATHMSLAFDAVLLGRNERRQNDRQQKGWHRYLEIAFRENRPWDEVAREVLLARADSKERGHLWFLHEHNNQHQDMAEAISRGFFGVDIACAQCHDHPLADEIKQAHYWGLVSFFNRSKNANSENGFAVAESAIGGFNDFANALAGTTDSATLLFLQRPEVPELRPESPDKQSDDAVLYLEVANEPRVPKFSRREKFVDEILTDHPLLARSMVNRIWALVLGRGIVHPVDNMDSEHPPSHPVLLDWLARDFQANNYDVKRLVRHLTRTRTYQLEVGLPQHATPSTFASGLEKSLTAEALTNSLAVVLSVDNPDKAIASKFRKLFPEVLPDNNLTSLKQAMMLTNWPELQQLFLDAAARLPEDSSKVEQVRELYATAFAREPTEDELFTVSDYLRAKKGRPAQAYSQVLWAMVCSAEFRFNH